MTTISVSARPVKTDPATAHLWHSDNFREFRWCGRTHTVGPVAA